MSRPRIIATAYACEPGRGSEPGIGWNIVREVSRTHRITVVTRANNRDVIENALRRDPSPGLEVVYFDLPAWARFWKRGGRGVQLYYYLWQIGAFRKARALHRADPFDVAHHVTFGRYWSPSLLPLLGIPMVWGPVGGGESAPAGFHRDFGLRGRVYEFARSAARWLGEHDPLVRMTARKCHVALPTTHETQRRLERLGVRRTRLLGNAALNDEEYVEFGQIDDPPAGPVRFLSVGRLLHWKGFHIGLRAFGRAELADAEYWIVGDGPERKALEELATDLGIEDQVRFLGSVPRSEVLEALGACHVLVHPSLHDSGGWACVEAMAAGRPVLCLELGGPAVLVDESVGARIEARGTSEAVDQLARAMTEYAGDETRRRAASEAATAKARREFTWSAKAVLIGQAYRDARAARQPASVPTADGARA